MKTHSKEPPGGETYKKPFSDTSIGHYCPNKNAPYKNSLEKTLKHHRAKDFVLTYGLPIFSAIAAIPAVCKAIRDRDFTVLCATIPNIAIFAYTTYNIYRKKSLFRKSKKNLDKLLNPYNPDKSLDELVNRRLVSQNM